jgi:hypothetical protein
MSHLYTIDPHYSEPRVAHLKGHSLIAGSLEAQAHRIFNLTQLFFPLFLRAICIPVISLKRSKYPSS